MVSFFVYNFFKAGFFDILKETQARKKSKLKQFIIKTQEKFQKTQKLPTELEFS